MWKNYLCEFWLVLFFILLFELIYRNNETSLPRTNYWRFAFLILKNIWAKNISQSFDPLNRKCCRKLYWERVLRRDLPRFLFFWLLLILCRYLVCRGQFIDFWRILKFQSGICIYVRCLINFHNRINLF